MELLKQLFKYEWTQQTRSLEGDALLTEFGPITLKGQFGPYGIGTKFAFASVNHRTHIITLWDSDDNVMFEGKVKITVEPI